MKDRYIIGECPRCHTLIIADARYRTKTCPKCLSKISVEDMNVMQSAKDSREARAILSKAKAVSAGMDQT